MAQIGGMTTPLASPQNAVAVVTLETYATDDDQKITFGEFLLCSSAPPLTRPAPLFTC